MVSACIAWIDNVLVCVDSAGGDLLRRRRRSLASSSTGRLLSLAEAQERERVHSGSTAFIEVGGGPAALPTKYHTVLDFPKRSAVVLFRC